MHADAACRAEPARARYARSACFRWSDALLGQTELVIAEQTATVKRCQLLDRGDRVADASSGTRGFALSVDRLASSVFGM